MAKLKIAKIGSSNTLKDQYTGPSHLGGTGGASQAITSVGVKTIAIAYNTTANAQIVNGYILHQKGAHKFRVADQSSNNITTATLVNVAGNLRTQVKPLSLVTTPATWHLTQVESLTNLFTILLVTKCVMY